MNGMEPRVMRPFSLIRDHAPALSSVEGVFALVADAIPDIAAAGGLSLNLANEEAAAAELARTNPDALVVLPHALAQRFLSLRRWPRTHASDIFAIKRLASDALASNFASVPTRRRGEGLRAAILVPWLSNNPNNNLLRVVASYAAGLLRHPGVEEAVVVVTNEIATGDPNRSNLPPDLKPKMDARMFEAVHARTLEEFGAPAGKLRYAPPPFSEGGNIRWLAGFDAGFGPDVVFVPNVEMTSSSIHGFGRNAATVYLQTSVNNRPPYDFDRYLYLGARREIDSSHIHPGRWHYHSFGYEPFGFGSRATRADMGFAEDDFIVVSAGNRLETEITAEISSVVASALGDDPSRKWLLLGARDEQRIRANMGEAAGAIGDRVVFKGYSLEVGDYLAHCDAYANPRRTGGAVSMSLAVYGGTPVISFDNNDACNFLLDEMICTDAGQYAERLRRLADDPGYRADVVARQRAKFDAGHTADASAADLVRHFHAAIAVRESEGN